VHRVDGFDRDVLPTVNGLLVCEDGRVLPLRLQLHNYPGRVLAHYHERTPDERMVLPLGEHRKLNYIVKTLEGWTACRSCHDIRRTNARA
jgi:hypothetical protein